MLIGIVNKYRYLHHFPVKNTKGGNQHAQVTIKGSVNILLILLKITIEITFILIGM